jgi:hypothetical protein
MDTLCLSADIRSIPAGTLSVLLGIQLILRGTWYLSGDIESILPGTVSAKAGTLSMMVDIQ